MGDMEAREVAEGPIEDKSGDTVGHFKKVVMAPKGDSGDASRLASQLSGLGDESDSEDDDDAEAEGYRRELVQAGLEPDDAEKIPDDVVGAVAKLVADRGR